MENPAHEQHKGKRKPSSKSPTLRKKIEKRSSRTGSAAMDGGDEREEVEVKIRALQRIVPGGESLGADKLFEETAGYIMALQRQLKAMKTIANFFEALDKENTKLGG